MGLYDPDMPLFLASILALVIFLLMLAIVLLYRRVDALNAAMIDQANQQFERASAMMREARQEARDSRDETPGLIHSMLGALSEATASATGAVKDAVSESLRASYPPVYADAGAGSEGSGAFGDTPDNMTPWYAVEGAVDDSDPTDGYLSRDQFGTTDNLAMGEEPFGIPGMKIGSDTEMPDVIGRV